MTYDIQQKLKKLEQKLRDNQIQFQSLFLFGSSARGTAHEWSDIDVAVVGRKNKVLSLDKFEKMLQRKIHVQFFTSFVIIYSNIKRAFSIN